jgi:hypothetical protein
VVQRPLKLSICCILIILFVINPSLYLTNSIFAQSSNNSQDELIKKNELTAEKLDRVIELLEQARQGGQIALYLTIIVFMTGLAFVVFSLYIGQEHKLSLFTKRLYIIAYFALIIPVTFILLRYIANTLLAGDLGNPVLVVAFLLIIPITASYILMGFKVKHDGVRPPSA